MELVRQKAYRKTLDIAASRLLDLPLEERAAKAGVAITHEGDVSRVSVPFFDETIDITIPGLTFKNTRGTNITLTARIIILHYIIHASGSPVGTELVPYEDIPGCRPYLPVFERRVTRPLIGAFGYARDAFVAAGKTLGGREEEYGSGSFTLRAFPRLPVTFILWEGEEDFPPSIKVLFDRSIHTYLPLEDIVVISKMAATRILKEAKKEYSEG
ncbi:MAG: DUF3786 domain-containing protein [Syntrophorhabdales bacterium]